MCVFMTKDSDFFENEIFLQRPKIANVAKWSHVESQPDAAGVQGCFRALEALGFFSAQICILPLSRDSFPLISDIYFNTKNG